MSSFFDELDRREAEARSSRLHLRPADLHDYQGCANIERRCVNWPCQLPKGHDGPCSTNVELMP